MFSSASHIAPALSTPPPPLTPHSPYLRSWGPFIGVALFLVGLAYGGYRYIQHYNTTIKPLLKPAKKEKLPKGMTLRKK